MKRAITVLSALIFLVSLVGCVGEDLSDVDTFLSAFNEKSPSPVLKEDIIGVSQDGKISHCLRFGDSLISLNCNEETMKIFSADIVTDKKPSDEFESAVRLTVSSLTTLADSDISALMAKLIRFDDGFYRLTETMHDYTFSFIFFDGGGKFTLSFNSLVPTETTSIPVTVKEFESYDVISEKTTG